MTKSREYGNDCSRQINLDKRYAYTLKFFENNSSRLPKWCNDADAMKLHFCHIRGKYQMDPYPHTMKG
ncbi:unnamed protein product [Camellia sinensis]